jgi:hypothetical protein
VFNLFPWTDPYMLLLLIRKATSCVSKYKSIGERANGSVVVLAAASLPAPAQTPEWG